MLITKYRFFSFLILFAGVSVFSSCEDDSDDDTNEPAVQNIVEIASGDDDLSILVQALTSANLAGTLTGEGPYTVFAPNNQAFQDLLDSNTAWSTLADIPSETLSNVLLFHVLSGEVTAGDLSDTYVNTLTNGANNEKASLQVEVTGGVEFNGDAAPLQTDISASNGVIHKVNKVMLPKNVVELALSNSNFSILVQALTDTRHTTDFVGTLTGDGPFTVFAPTNTAFQALLDSNNDWDSLTDIPIETLDAVLKYHVFAGGNVQSDELTDNQMITMFNEGTVTVDLSNGAKLETSSDQSVSIIITDVQGTNGVIHAVQEVLLP